MRRAKQASFEPRIYNDEHGSGLKSKNFYLTFLISVYPCRSVVHLLVGCTVCYTLGASTFLPGMPAVQRAGRACGSGEIGRHTILRGWRRKAWGFKSPLPHHTSLSATYRD